MNLFSTLNVPSVRRILATIAFALIVSSFNILAQPGSPDTAFNGSGKVQTDVSTAYGAVNDMYAYPDGKLLVAGISYAGGNDSRTTLVRYNANGSLDSTFGTGGVVNLNPNLFNQTEEAPFGLAVYPATGKIAVVAEHSTGVLPAPTRDLLIYQLNSDGSLDTDFSDDGIFTFDYSGANSVEDAADIAYLSDGRIAVLGNTSTGGSDQTFFLQLTADGFLDASINQGFGFIALEFPTSTLTRSFGARMAIQPNGKIVVVGSGFQAETLEKDAFIARLETDGTPDTSFDADGFRIFDFSPIGDEFLNVALNSTGGIYAAGDTAKNTSALLVRFNADGSLNTNFDTDGIATFGGTNFDSGLGMAVTPNGKVMFTFGKDDKDFHVLTVNPNGALDSTFGTGGEARISLTNNIEGYDVAYAAAIDGVSGKIYVAGEAVDDVTDANMTRFGVARLQGATVTSATVSLGGRVTRGGKNALGLAGVNITVTSLATGAAQIVRTNSLGRYRFDNLPSGDAYIVTAASRLYRFSQPTITLNLLQDEESINFVAQ